jgi:cell division transport system permease protein
MPESKKLIRKTQRSSWISTIVSISLVLFLLGVLGVLLLHAQKISNYVKENIEISLVLKPDADSLSINDLYKRVSTANYVKSARLVSKEEAAATLKQELGEDFVSFLGYNPLFPSIDVRLRAEFADNNTIQSFLNSVKANPVVKEVQYQASLVESINRNLRSITWILLAFSGLLIIVSVALINNTIRISLYARRMLIKSMLLVGATKGFIRKPFLIRSFWNGVVGGIISILLLGGLFYFTVQELPELTLIRDYKLMGIVAGCLILSGALLSLICTLFAVNKYLRYRTNDLY